MKVVIIGCTHAGTITASQILSQHPDTEVTIYEKNDNVSFLSCGIATYLGGVAQNIDDMFYSSPEALSQLGATVRMQHEVTSCLLYTSPSPRDRQKSRMPSSA